jgi:hypothetical protein
VYNKYYANVPVYTDFETFRQSPEFEAPRELTENGNIYFKDDYLFVIEADEGIHFIDNTNPSAPNNVGFLDVWGCTGMAIRGNYLYVNSFIDLLVYNVSDINSPQEVKRLEDVFPMALPVSDKNYPISSIDKSKGVVTSWKVEKVKEEVDNSNVFWNNCVNCEFAVAESSGGFTANSASGTATAPVGIAGSISLFTVVGDYLYVMSEDNLQPFNLSDPANPSAKQAVGVWGDVETLFPYEDYIFMGTPTGMLVYGTSNPDAPNYLSQFSHARGCDPVVVQNDIAYVTVRSGGPCGGNINQMDVIDVSDVNNPILQRSFEMSNPHGLGIDGELLFVCDGKAGLKVYDASDPVNSGDNMIKKFGNIQATDVIPFDNVAMVIGDDGIYQYDYSDPSELVLLSKIKF